MKHNTHAGDVSDALLTSMGDGNLINKRNNNIAQEEMASFDLHIVDSITSSVLMNSCASFEGKHVLRSSSESEGKKSRVNDHNIVLHNS